MIGLYGGDPGARAIVGGADARAWTTSKEFATDLLGR